VIVIDQLRHTADLSITTSHRACARSVKQSLNNTSLKPLVNCPSVKSSPRSRRHSIATFFVSSLKSCVACSEDFLDHTVTSQCHNKRPLAADTGLRQTPAAIMSSVDIRRRRIAFRQIAASARRASRHSGVP